jgi:alkylation response protein AidB-like acyl-CoA dehydrogenase/cytochrome b involved in lipid metabolism
MSATYFTAEDVSKHNKKADCWMIVNGGVYDVTEFMEIHPGGAGILLTVAGKDASDYFNDLHNPEILDEIGEDYKIGVVGDASAAAAAAAEAEASSGGVLSMADVQQHSSPDDCWIVIEDKVYDVTEFMHDHPGGPKPLMLYGGKDATEEFTMVHHPQIIKTLAVPFQVGILEQPEAHAPPAVAPSALVPTAKRTNDANDPVLPGPLFGDLVPSGDPQWYQGFRSPHYKQTHFDFRAKVRAFVEEVIEPNVEAWEDNAFWEPGQAPDPSKQVPAMGLMKAAAEWGLLPATMGGEWPSAFTTSPPPEDYDLYHSQILIEELGRPSSEVASIILTGLIIGLRSVMQFGLQTPEATHEVVSSCLSGDKQICLCMSEPYAGSDVANLTCRAELSADKTHYILNGQKKWITGGIYSDYFNVACRTGASGSDGLSMLLVRRDAGGVHTRKMPVTGWWASGTTYVTFEDVKVPVDYVVGTAGMGFKQMMMNLNHERWFVSVLANRHARTALEEALSYTQKRKTMGKFLVEHQLIRAKISQMTMAVESSQQMIDHMTYQMIHMDEEEQRVMLAGMSALLKVQTCRAFEMCTREASQCMGGISYVRTGQGRKLEVLLRTVRAFVIFAGSEEVMLDLGARQMVRMQRALQDAGPAAKPRITMTGKM